MRSRYSAYALGLADYIIATTHPDCEQVRPTERAWREEILLFARGTSFDGLRLLESGALGEDKAWVIFRATLDQGGQDASFTERSGFVRDRDRGWLYASAEELSEEGAASAEAQSNTSAIQTP